MRISRRGDGFKIIFPRREGTYQMEWCISSNSLGDWYGQHCSITSVDFCHPPPPHPWPSHSSLRGNKDALNFFKMWYPDYARQRSVQVLLVSVSPRQLSTFPLERYSVFHSLIRGQNPQQCKKSRMIHQVINKKNLKVFYVFCEIHSVVTTAGKIGWLVDLSKRLPQFSLLNFCW